MTEPVRRVGISDSPLTTGERMRLRLRRFWAWFWESPVEPVRGRLEVIKAQQEGRLIPPELLVHSVKPGNIVARARPKASMTLRVYRAATGEWSEPFSVDSVDIKVQHKEG